MDYPIIGKSKATEDLRKQVAKIAKTQKDILIIGETGTGKGAVAGIIVLLAGIPFVLLKKIR